MEKPTITLGKSIPLFIQKYERYLPTAFDDSMTILEKMNKIIVYLNQIGEITDDVVKQWNDLIEWIVAGGLNDVVEFYLHHLIEDGTIGEVINNDLLKDINDKILALQNKDKSLDEMDSTLRKEFQAGDNSLLQKIDSILEQINSKDVFDIRKLNPQFIRGIGGIRNAVNQSVNIDDETYQIYITQVDSKNPEGFYISRLAPSGEYISGMLVPNGGHGTMIGLDRKTNGDLKIWFYHTGLKKLVQAKYKDDYRLEESEVAEMTDYTPASLMDEYFSVTFDPYHDNLVFRTGTGRVEIRDRMEVRNHVDNILYQVQTDKTENTDDVMENPMQGCTAFGSDIYYQSGSSEGTMKISKYDGITGTKTFEYNARELIGQYGRYNFHDKFHEPEGLAFFVNPITKKKTLLFIITTGGTEKRHNFLYGFNQENDNSFWDTISRMNSQGYALTKPDGRALSIPDGTKSLDELVKPGYYYITNGMSLGLEGYPYPQQESGWYLHVFPLSQVFGGIQHLIRYSTENRIFKMMRAFKFDRETFTYSFGEWTVDTTNSRHQEYIRASDWGYSVANITLPGEYYMTQAQVEAMSDTPDKTGGFRLYNSGADSDRNIRQTLERNSETWYQRFTRRLNPTTKQVSQWILVDNVKI